MSETQPLRGILRSIGAVLVGVVAVMVFPSAPTWFCMRPDLSTSIAIIAKAFCHAPGLAV